MRVEELLRPVFADSVRPSGVFRELDFFFSRTTLRDRPKGPPTPNRHQPPTTNRHQPPTSYPLVWPQAGNQMIIRNNFKTVCSQPSIKQKYTGAKIIDETHTTHYNMQWIHNTVL